MKLKDYILLFIPLIGFIYGFKLISRGIFSLQINPVLFVSAGFYQGITIFLLIIKLFFS